MRVSDHESERSIGDVVLEEEKEAPETNLTLISENSYDEADLDESHVNQVKDSSIEK